MRFWFNAAAGMGQIAMRAGRVAPLNTHRANKVDIWHCCPSVRSRELQTAACWRATLRL